MIERRNTELAAENAESQQRLSQAEAEIAALKQLLAEKEEKIVELEARFARLQVDIDYLRAGHDANTPSSSENGSVKGTTSRRKGQGQRRGLVNFFS